jgi:hypothetical protein
VRDDVTIGHVGAELEGDRDRPVGGAPCLLAAERERARIVEAAGQDVGDGLGEDLGPVEIEELADARGHEADVASYVDPAHVQRIHRGDFEEESVAHLGDASGALLLEELASMLRILDAVMLYPASRIPRNDVVAVKEADLHVAWRRA